MHYKIVDIIDHDNGNWSVIVENPFGSGTISFGFKEEQMNDPNEPWKDVIEKHLLEMESRKSMPKVMSVSDLKAKYAGKEHEAKPKSKDEKNENKGNMSSG